MRSSFLIRFLLRSLLTTLVTSQLTVKLAAHDLPSHFPVRSVAQATVSGCLGNASDSSRCRSNNQVVHLQNDVPESGTVPLQLRHEEPQLSSAVQFCLKTITSPPLVTDDAFWKLLVLEALQQVSAPEQAQDIIPRVAELTATPNSHWTLALPEAGQPPSPSPRQDRQLVAQSRTLAQTVAVVRSLVRGAENRDYVPVLENYQPYDLEIRDWQFGQFQSRKYSQLANDEFELIEGFSAKKEAANLPPKSIVKAWLTTQMKLLRSNVGTSRQRIELAQNLFSRLHAGRDQVSQSLVGFVESENLFFVRYPYYTQPPFVYFQSADGHEFVFDMQQARAWGLISDIVEERAMDQTSDQFWNAASEWIQLRLASWHQHLVEDWIVRLDNTRTAMSTLRLFY